MAEFIHLRLRCELKLGSSARSMPPVDFMAFPMMLQLTKNLDMDAQEVVSKAVQEGFQDGHTLATILKQITDQTQLDRRHAEVLVRTGLSILSN